MSRYSGARQRNTNRADGDEPQVQVRAGLDSVEPSDLS